MGELFQNELLKIKHSGAVKIVFGVYMAYTLMCALAPADAESALMRGGAFAPFGMIANFGGLLFIFAGVNGGLIDREYEWGTIHNALGCGVERTKYFAVKVICILCNAVFVYVCSTCLYSVLRGLLFGTGLEGEGNYVLKVFVYNIAGILFILSYQSLFIFISVFCRKAVKTFGISVAVNIVLNAFSSYGVNVGIPVKFGLGAAVVMRDMAASNNIFSAEFAVLQLPHICVGVIALLLAFRIFASRDIQ